MPKLTKSLYFYELPKNKYNLSYIKKNKNILFVYDLESDLRVEQLKKLKNVISVDLKKVKHDGFFEKNKKLIKSEFKKVFKFAIKHKLKKITIPLDGIGNSLKQSSPKSYQYCNKLVRKFVKDFRGTENDNIKGKLIVNSKKNLSKNDRKKSKKSLKKIKKILKKIDKYCDKCNDSIKLVSKNVHTQKKEGKKFVKELEKKIKSCKKCESKCKKIQDKSKYLVEDVDIVKTRYPKICRKGPNNKTKVSRIKEGLREKLKDQYEAINEN